MTSLLILTVIILINQISINSAEVSTDSPIEIQTEIPIEIQTEIPTEIPTSRSKISSKEFVKDSVKKDGFCPEFGMTKILCELSGQEDSCDSDSKCEGKQLCCGDVCGRQCKDPIDESMPSKPNECPAEDENETCTLAPEDFHYCRDDYACVGEKKCCQVPCGSECLAPIWKPI